MSYFGSAPDIGAHEYTVVIPSVGTAVAVAVAPSVTMSIQVTPPSVAVVAALVAPSVAFGSATVVPASVVAEAAVVSPATVGASITPPATTVNAALVSPDINLGSTVASPASAAITATIHGSGMTFILVTPWAAVAEAVLLGPGVTLGAVSASDLCATAEAEAGDPFDIFPAQAVVEAVVDGEVAVAWPPTDPSAAEAVVVAPDINLGNVLVTRPIADAETGFSPPIVYWGWPDPVAISAEVAVVAPVVLFGATEVTPAAAIGESAVVAPGVAYGSATVTPDTAAVETTIRPAESTPPWVESPGDPFEVIDRLRIKVDDPPSGHAQLFDVDDILRCKVRTNTGALIDNWLLVEETLDPRDHGYPDADWWEYCVSLESGTPGELPAGAAIVNYGQSGDGYVKLTSDESYSPFIDIATHTGAPWSTITTHVRVGNLDGVLGLGAEWGMAAGTDLSDDTAPHIVFSDQQVGLWGVKQTWWDSAGNARGQVDPSAGASDVLFWLGPSEAGARFKVLGSGDVWLDTLAISSDLGDFLFSQADGLLLLGPGCEINDGEWWSLRRLEATINGAFHQEPGRWPGTRGLVIEPGITNFVENPSFEVNVTDYWVTALGTSTRVTTDSRYGSACDRLSVAAATDPYIYRASGVVNPVQGQKYTLSAWVKGTGSSIGHEVRVYIREAGGLYSDASNYETSTLTDQWQRISVTRTIVEDDRTALNIWVRFYFDGAMHGYIDGVQLENLGYATSYCDGDQGHDYSWNGTVGLSKSVRVATTVVIPTAGSIEAAEGYVAMWFKVPMWTDPATQMLWSAGDVNQELDAHIATNGAIVYRINGATRCDSASGAATKDIWHLAVFNWKVSTNVSELYIDGLSVDTGTCGGATPTLHANLGIGGSTVLGSAYGFCGVLSEFATGKTMLTATNVAALYALQRPLADAGALDSPGIYILDGRFRIASSLTGARMDLDETGLIFVDGSGNTLVGLDATDASFTLKSAASGTRMELSAAGGLRFYNGSDLLIDLDASDASFTLKSATTGAHIEVTPDYIAGYSDATTKEFYIRASDGKAVFGGEKITLDGTGATIVADTTAVDIQAYKFAQSGTVCAGMYAWGDGANTVRMWAKNISLPATAEMKAETDAGNEARCQMIVDQGGTGCGIILYKNRATVGGPFRPGTGTADPTADLEDGMLFYRTDTDKMRLRANGAWVNLN